MRGATEAVNIPCAHGLAPLLSRGMGGVWSSKRSRELDPFIFAIALVAIISVGRTVRAVAVESIRSRRQLQGDSPPGGGEIVGVREAMDGMLARLDRLEEERDFYKDLLDAPGARREIPPSAGEDAAESGPSTES